MSSHKFLRIIFISTLDKGARLFFIAALLATTAIAITDVTPAYAASLTVNTEADELNSNGNCSLREAITNANLDATVYSDCQPTGGYGADVIVLPTGTYTLTISGAGEDANATGDLDILDADGLTIQSDTTTAPFP